jgi:hypothetical protein
MFQYGTFAFNQASNQVASCPTPMTLCSTRRCFRPGFVWKLTAVVAVLCLITLAIAMTGRMIGGTIALAGNTTDQRLHEIVIGNDVLSLPANVIRFESQRISGVQGAVDTYFAWPGMSGYTQANRDIFNQTRVSPRIDLCSNHPINHVARHVRPRQSDLWSVDRGISGGRTQRS